MSSMASSPPASLLAAFGRHRYAAHRRLGRPQNHSYGSLPATAASAIFQRLELAESFAGPQSESLQNPRQRTETRERRLQQIRADERRQPQPSGMMQLRQQQADQNYGSGKGQHGPIDRHLQFLLASVRSYARRAIVDA
jgi:hypothetical protein